VVGKELRLDSRAPARGEHRSEKKPKEMGGPIGPSINEGQPPNTSPLQKKPAPRASYGKGCRNRIPRGMKDLLTLVQ